MFRFTIRDMLWLTVIVAMALAWWNQYRLSHRPPKLYRDEEAYDISTNPKYVVDRFDNPYLLIVPRDKTMPRQEVFKRLGIDANRLTNFNAETSCNGVRILSWKLSPSYDLVCITANAIHGSLEMDSPNREICCVRIVKREPDPDTGPQAAAMSSSDWAKFYRFKAAENELEASQESPTRSPFERLHAIEALAQAAIELPHSSERVDECKRALEAARKLESEIRAKYESDDGSLHLLERVSQSVRDIEIKLQQARMATEARDT